MQSSLTFIPGEVNISTEEPVSSLLTRRRSLVFFFFFYILTFSFLRRKKDFSSSLATQITYLRIYEEFLYSDSRDFHPKSFFQKNSRNYILASAAKLGVLLPSCVETARTVKRTVTLPHSSRHLILKHYYRLFIDPHVYLQCLEVPIQPLSSNLPDVFLI